MCNREVKWRQNLAKVEAFILKHGSKPSRYSTDAAEKKLATWLKKQVDDYLQRQGMMKNVYIWSAWTTFASDQKQLLDTFDEDVHQWMSRAKEVREFLQMHDDVPSRDSMDTGEQKLAVWIRAQRKHYIDRSSMMMNESIRREWNALLHDHKRLIHHCPTQWRRTLRALKGFRIREGRWPVWSLDRCRDAEEKSFVRWIATQDNYYDAGTGVMKNALVRMEWRAFILLRRESDAQARNRLIFAARKFMKTRFGRMPSQYSECVAERYLAIRLPEAQPLNIAWTPSACLE